MFLRCYVKIFLAITFLTITFSHDNVAQGLTNADSTATIDVELILKSEQKIQGITYQIEVNASSLDSGLLQLGFSKSLLQPSLYVSDTLSNFPLFLALQDSVKSGYNKNGKLYYYLFDKEVGFSAIEAYVENLIRNELLIPSDAVEAANSEKGALIVKGAKLPFKPFYKVKIKILNDIKMILLISILLLFLMSSLLLVVAMFIMKARKHTREILSKRFKKLSYEPLSTLLFEYDLEQISFFSKTELQDFFPKKYLSRSLFKDVMIQEIISLNKNMKGDFKTKLKVIYRKLSLDQYTLQKISSNRWDIITTGIVEANEMDVYEAVPMLEKYISHPNFYIRSNAVATTLNLSEDRDLMVLAKQKFPLSKWQQMIYLRIIKFISLQDFVKIIYLLESDNESVRIFGIKLVKYLGRTERISKLSEMFPAASHAEKIEILKIYDAFNAEDYLDQVHQSLFSEDEKLCLRAIRTLENLGNNQSQALLLERLNMLEGFELKKAILKSLYVLNKDVFQEIIDGEMDPVVNKISNHLKDPVLSDV